MSNIIGLFKSEPEAKAGSDKLLDLYWNRAELKKAFASLRNEKYQLQDRIKAHEGATARVQQKLDHIENLLLDPEWVHNVVAYYQLQRLSNKCHSKLSRFAEQIKQQREQKIHSKLIDEWRDGLRQQAAVIESELGQNRIAAQQLEDRLQSEQHRLLTMNGLQRFFRGKRLSREITGLEEQVRSCLATENQLHSALVENNNQSPPDHIGLSIVEKRSINVNILAYAQHLYLHFADFELAELAKEASEKSVGAIRYGNKRDSDEILARIKERYESVDKTKGFADVLRKRAQKLSQCAVYRNDDDAVPIAASVDKVFVFGKNGVVAERDVNLLGQNYFGVAKVLSR